MVRDLSKENEGLQDPASMSYTWHLSYLPQEEDYSDLHAMKHHEFYNSEIGLSLIILMQKVASATFMLSLHFHCSQLFTIGLLQADFIFPNRKFNFSTNKVSKELNPLLFRLGTLKIKVFASINLKETLIPMGENHSTSYCMPNHKNKKKKK